MASCKKYENHDVWSHQCSAIDVLYWLLTPESPFSRLQRDCEYNHCARQLDRQMMLHHSTTYKLSLNHASFTGKAQVGG